MLSAGAGGTVHIDAKVFSPDIHIHIFRFRKHGYGNSGGVYPALAFGFRNALHPVHAAFKFQNGVGILSFNGACHFLETAQVRFIGIGNLQFPAFPFCKLDVHLEKVRCKEGCLFTAGAGTDFKDDVLAVIGVLGNEHFMDFQVQLFHFLFIFLQVFLGQLVEVRLGLVFQNFLRIPDSLVRFLVFPVLGYNVPQFRMFLGQGPPSVLVRNDRGVAELVLQGHITGFHALQFTRLHMITPLYEM